MKRPVIEETMCNKAYKNLIERCWSQDPKSRPSFSEIVNELERNFDFITPNINYEEYRRYIKFIKESPIYFDSTKQILTVEHILKLDMFNFSNINSKINIRNIYETELNNVLCNYDYINIHNFTKQKLINFDYFYKMY